MDPAQASKVDPSTVEFIGKATAARTNICRAKKESYISLCLSSFSGGKLYELAFVL